jgi:hypothetical protein
MTHEGDGFAVDSEPEGPDEVSREGLGLAPLKRSTRCSLGRGGGSRDIGLNIVDEGSSSSLGWFLCTSKNTVRRTRTKRKGF